MTKKVFIKNFMDNLLQHRETEFMSSQRNLSVTPFSTYLSVEKKMKKYILLIVLITFCKFSFAQDEQPYAKKSFVIIQSTKNYTAAKATANKAAKALKLKLDLRNLKPTKQSELTYSKKECEDNGFEYPCYVSRGRYDDGEYVSIEWSDAFNSFTKGYYIVIVYSGNKNEANTALKKVKKVFADAYAKEDEVYMGCIH
jgi:hypothetical protein